MPIHFRDLDVLPEVEGLSSALIVPCFMCPAVTVAVRERRPFIEPLRHLLRSAPFEEYMGRLRSRLRECGVDSDVFRSIPSHQWFMCMWTEGKRRKLRERARLHDAVIVLGCASATDTVREAVGSTGCKVIEGMEVTGVMNARIRFRFPARVSFEECKTVPLSRQVHGGGGAG